MTGRRLFSPALFEFSSGKAGGLLHFLHECTKGSEHFRVIPKVFRNDFRYGRPRNGAVGAGLEGGLNVFGS